MAELTLTPDEAGGLAGKLRDLRPALEQIGAALTSISSRAFEEQRLGDVLWDRRYPNQGEPVVNIAGVLSDLNRGSSIKARRFEGRPALSDTGRLAGSIDHEISGSDTVRVGTTVEYAGLMQLGGKSKQPVTETAKKKLAKWIASRQRKAKKARKEARGPSTNPIARDVAKPDPLVKKLRFLLNVDELETSVVARPFLGITDEARQDIPRIIADEVARQAGGGHGNG